MKNYLIVLVLPILFACGGSNKQTTALEDSLAKANSALVNEMNEKDTVIHSKEAALSEFVKTFNEIQDNLNQIKAKENILSTSTEGIKLSASAKDQIINDIQFIYDQMNKNKAKLVSVSNKLKDSNLKIDDLETAIANLHVQITNNENEISALRSRLEKLNVDFSNLVIDNTHLQETYIAAKQASDLKTKMLNTAYYIVGTSEFLKKNDVITKEGGFIGIGKTEELNKNLDNIIFIRIDITKITVIPLNAAKKVKLITPHHTDSYKLIKGTGYDKLMILDPQKFWGTSKYLVIETEE